MSKRREPQPHELERTRECIGCHEVKVWAEFPAEKKDAEGNVITIKSRCHECRAVLLRKRHAEMTAARPTDGFNVERIPEPWEWLQMKVCSCCAVKKAWAFYSPREYWPDGTVRSVGSRCRECRAKERSRHKNSEARRTYQREWRRRQRAQIRAERAEGGTRLPGAPFKSWLRFVEVEEGGLARLAEDAGLHPDTLAKVLSRNDCVMDKTAEAALCARGAMLADIYPELQEAA